MKKSDVSKKDNKVSTVKAHTVDIIKPIFNKVPQETFSDSMTITKKGVRRLWRPNNYRRQMKVKERSDSTAQEIKGTMGSFPVEISKKKIITVRNYGGVTVQYARHTLTAIYSQNIIGGEKEVFVIEASTHAKIEEWIVKKKKEIKHLIDTALLGFARKFNIVIVAEKPIWSRHEDWTSDKEIKKIPEWTIIHGDHMKKVYPEGVEYVGGKGEEPTSQLINRVRNTGLRDFAPEIVSQLEEIKLYQTRREALFFLKENVFIAQDVITYTDYVNLLSDVEKDEFCNWMFDKLGGMYGKADL